MMTESKKRMLERYNEGLGFYKQRRFAEALECFHRALDAEPGDGPTKFYIKRCHDLMKQPPPSDWDGVFTMTTK